MTPEQWHRVKEVFEAALERAPGERSAFLGQACSGDELLYGEVQSLLSSHEQEKSFMEKPATALAARSLIKEESAALVGQQLGHYQIDREIGRGGMGVVYLAHDSSLGRPVALKLLPKHLTRDPNRLRRFELEARAASALNHHNILTIYQIAQLDGFHFIATEYIDGVTLRERINGNELKLSEALNIAQQIASALVAAHEAGIVHRDIKPENVMLRRDGYVKVLDFGLAKLTEQEPGAVVASLAVLRGTNTDTGVMGTVGYMSPEQARGESVDHRTDFFSLGVVIYEMVTGHMPFEVKTVSDLIEPTVERKPAALVGYLPEVPADLQMIVTRALRANRDERYQTTVDFLTDLKNVRVEPRPKNRFTAGRLSLLVATLTLMAGLLWVYAPRESAKPSLPPMKIVPFTSSPGSEWLGGFSPDGNQIAFAWTGKEDNFVADIYVKQIGVEKPLRVTSDPAQDVCAVWSPDGKSIGFMRYLETGPAIFTVSSQGGGERKLVELGQNVAFCGWDWSPDGKFIAFGNRDPKEGPFKIFLVSLDTLARHALTSPGADILSALNPTGDSDPVFSPDGRSIAFVRQSAFLSADIYIVPITGGEPRRLTFNNTPIAGLSWSTDGREIIFSQIASRIFDGNDGSLWRVSTSGGTAERLPVSGYNAILPHISRRENRLAYVQTSGELNIYRLEVSDKTVSKYPPTKLVASTRHDDAPQFSPDGRRIVFSSDRSGQFEIWTCNTDGTDAVPVTSLNKFASSPRWSPDGRQIAFDFLEDRRGQIYVTGVEGGLPRAVTSGDFDNISPSWSMNGQWIYFSSNRTGGYEVWRVPAQGGEAVRVTKQEGRLAFESPDGKYVYYVKNHPTKGIWRMPVEGGDEFRVLDSFNSEFFGDWAVVNEGIYFIDVKDESTIQFFEFASQRTRPVAKLGKLQIGRPSLSISPDRRQILYARLDNIGQDIMLVENFR